MITGFGELALRVNDLPAMKAFYRDVVGLEVFDETESFLVFFKIGEAIDGHPQLFALFDREVEVGQPQTTLDHFAFLIDLDSYDAERDRLERSGVVVFPKIFPHRHWRSLFFADPEGNTVEFVTYDPSV